MSFTTNIDQLWYSFSYIIREMLSSACLPVLPSTNNVVEMLYTNYVTNLLTLKKAPKTLQVKWTRWLQYLILPTERNSCYKLFPKQVWIATVGWALIRIFLPIQIVIFHYNKLTVLFVYWTWTKTVKPKTRNFLFLD